MAVVTTDDDDDTVVGDDFEVDGEVLNGFGVDVLLSPPRPVVAMLVIVTNHTYSYLDRLRTKTN